MQATDLLRMLEDNGIEQIDNQEIANRITGGVEPSALFGDMKGGLIEGNFAAAMPEPTVMMTPTHDFENDLPTFDVKTNEPGLS